MAHATMHLVTHAFDERGKAWLALIVGVLLAVGVLLFAGGVEFAGSLPMTNPNLAP